MGEPFHWRSMTSVLRGSPDVKAWHAALALARRSRCAGRIRAPLIWSTEAGHPRKNSFPMW